MGTLKYPAIAALLYSLLLSGCGQTSDSSTSAATDLQPDSGSAVATFLAPDSARVARLWARSCALCHVNGEGGAPRMGHADEWQPRLAQGQEQLLRHTIDGYGNMPPLGYCMGCEREDLQAMIKLMAGVDQ